MTVLLALLHLASTAAPAVANPPVAIRPAAPLRATVPILDPARPDEGDEEAAVIAGIAKRGLHETVISEAEAFLRRFASHRRAPGVRYHLADALYELGRTAEALQQYRLLDRVQGFEQAVEVDFRIGQCALETGDDAAAAQAFAAAAQGAAETPEAAYLRVPATYSLAEALFRSERFAEAAGAYRATLALEESDGWDAYARDARYGAVWSAFKAGDPAATVTFAEAFRAAHGNDEQGGEIAFLAGESELTAGHPAEAITWYGRVTSGPYAAGAVRGAAFAEVERGDSAAAARRFGELLERFGDSQYASEAALQRGVQLERSGDHAGAIEALAHPAVPKDALAAYWRATAFAGLGRHEDALKAARAGLEASPDEALAAQLRIAAGDALFELGRAAEAAELYESSGNAYALHAAAVARLNAGDHAEAARLAQTLLTGSAREAGTEYRGEALLTRAEALFRMGRYGEAEPVLRNLIAETTPSEGGAAATALSAAERARARARLAWCRWYADDAAAARAQFDSVAADGEARLAERLEATFMAGRAALAVGDEAVAAKRFRAYLSAAAEGPFAAESHLRLARLTEGAEGLVHYDRIVEAFPKSELVPAALSEAAERRVALGQTEAAAANYAALVGTYPNDPLSRNARYGLGWARYQAGEHRSAAEPLWAVARDTEAPDDLRTAAAELLVWVEAGAESPDGVRAAMSALLGRIDDGPRILRAARVADAALAEAEDLDARDALWSSVAREVAGPELAAARVEQGFVALDRGDVAAAAERAAEAREAEPTDASAAELTFFVAEALFDAGEGERAEPLYALAARHGRDAVAERALYKAGFSALRRGANDAATGSFAKLIERFPAGVLFPESLYLAGEAKFRAGEYAEASQWLWRMTQEFPGHESRPKALFRLGVAKAHLEEWKVANQALTELIARHQNFPSLVEAELWRGRAQSRLGELRGAQQSLARVVEADEGILAAQARIELGRLAEAQNDDEGAVAEYLKVAVLYGHAEECAEALVRAGDVLERTGKPDRARDCWKEAKDDYPKTTWAAKAAERLK